MILIVDCKLSIVEWLPRRVNRQPKIGNRQSDPNRRSYSLAWLRPTPPLRLTFRAGMMSSERTIPDRSRRIETLNLLYKVSAVASVVSMLLAIIYFFAAHTGEYVRDWNVEPVWRNFKVSAIATAACGFAALIFFVSARWAAKALERYTETHCNDCGHDLAPIIAEKLEKRKQERKTGAALHGSQYFDVYCPICKGQRTVRE